MNLNMYIGSIKWLISVSSLIEWCFMLLSTVFHSYHRDSSHYSCLSWVSPVLGWALKCLAQGHSDEKTQRLKHGSNPGPLDYETNTLPLSHMGPFQSAGQKTVVVIQRLFARTSCKIEVGLNSISNLMAQLVKISVFNQ